MSASANIINGVMCYQDIFKIMAHSKGGIFVSVCLYMMIYNKHNKVSVNNLDKEVKLQHFQHEIGGQDYTDGSSISYFINFHFSNCPICHSALPIGLFGWYCISIDPKYASVSSP